MLKLNLNTKECALQKEKLYWQERLRLQTLKVKESMINVNRATGNRINILFHSKCINRLVLAFYSQSETFCGLRSLFFDDLLTENIDGEIVIPSYLQIGFDHVVMNLNSMTKLASIWADVNDRILSCQFSENDVFSEATEAPFCRLHLIGVNSA